MTNEEAISYLEGQRACICSEDCQNNYDYTHCEQGFLCNDVEAINVAIEALKAQDVPEINVGDMISRQGAIDVVKKHYRIDNDLLELIVYEIEQLPSVQPEIIHCKDCKYLKHDTIFNQAWCSHPNPKGTLMVFDDSSEYCSMAERECDG